MKSIKVGVLGAGRIGRLHAENLKFLPQAELVAISDLYAEEMREWALQCGFQHVTPNANDVIDHSEVEAIFVCTPTDTHPDLIKRAILNGKHIFCEKPISFSLKETSEIVELARQEDVLLQVGFNRRYDHHFQAVKESLLAGEIGKIHSLKITSRDPLPPPIEYTRSSGGLFIDMAIHDYDMLRYITGENPTEIYVKATTCINPEIELLGDVDTAFTMVTFESGILAVVDNSRKANFGYDQRIEVFGDYGSLMTDNETTSSLKISTAERITTAKPKHFFLERYKDTYIREALDFLECVALDKRPAIDGFDGLQAELMAYAAKKSYLEKRPVTLDEVQQELTATP